MKAVSFDIKLDTSSGFSLGFIRLEKKCFWPLVSCEIHIMSIPMNCHVSEQNVDTCTSTQCIVKMKLAV